MTIPAGSVGGRKLRLKGKGIPGTTAGDFTGYAVSSAGDSGEYWMRAPKRRRSPKESGGAGAIRYFLTKTTSNGTPELDQEMPDEHQALIAALKQDRSFVSVKEWRAKVDIKKGAPVIEKDPVVRE